MTRDALRRWLGRPVLCVATIVAVAVLAAGCSGYNRRGWGTGIGAATGAAAGYALAGDDSGLEGALIGGAVGAGSGYLIGSQLEKSEQRSVMQSYNHLMKIENEKAVRQEIDQLGDKVLGNSDGYCSEPERQQALNQLEYAMETAADEMGNRDGTTSARERNEYINAYKDRPVVQIVSGQGG